MNPFNQYTFKNGATMKNHFALAPMTTWSSNPDLTLSEEEEVYYNSRAKEFGMVITAACAVSKQAQGFERQISIANDDFIPSMKRLAKSIKTENSLAIIQLYHGGRMAKPGLFEGQDIVSASAVKPNREGATTPRELKTKEVYEIIEDFKNAARRSYQAGFDGVELHGANTYLIQQFVSPHSNLRTDEFGGNDEKRLLFSKLLVQGMKEIRNEINDPSFVIGYRLSPEELETPGITIAITKKLVQMLVKEQVDYIHLSTGHFNQSSLRDKEDKQPIIAHLLPLVPSHIPVIGVGGIYDKEAVDELFECGYSLIALGSIALADKHIVTNLKEGNEINTHFSKDSLLPTLLYNRLKEWYKEHKLYTIE